MHEIPGSVLFIVAFIASKQALIFGSKIIAVFVIDFKATMEKTREPITLTYPHDLYRRFKEDEYFALDKKVATIDETCENRFTLASKG